MFQKIVFVLVMALFSVEARTQPTQAISLLRELHKPLPDSTRGRLLLQLGTYYIERIGELTSDLDSALLFARAADQLYRKDHDTAGVEAATLLTGKIYSEAKRYSLAESLLPQLLYNGQLQLLQTIILYRNNTNGNDWRDADSAIHLCRELIELSHSRNMSIEEAFGWLHLGIFYYWLNKGSDARAALQRGWAVQEKAKNVQYELTYLSIASRWSGADSTNGRTI